MQVIKEEGSRPIKAWVGQKIGNDSVGLDGRLADGSYPDSDCLQPDIEEAALIQAKNLARLPFIHHNGVALMPDVHAGIGSTVGSVIATRGAIIPAAVGVDIGCGMNAVRTSLKASDLPDNLRDIRHQIERDIPLGAGGAVKKAEDIQFRENFVAYSLTEQVTPALMDLFRTESEADMYDKLVKKAAPQLGSLGSGNHFIEICIDENQDVWIMLHSGSRGIGNMIGSHYIKRAKADMEKWMIHLPDTDLAYFPEGAEHFKPYIAAVGWAQHYALQNRKMMMSLVIAAFQRHMTGKPFTLTSEAINCHHNYTEQENHFGENLWITRKGAVRARVGDLGIIPGSMGQRSYIVRGKGNPESYCSCSHGAGRIMSRTAARKRFTVQDLKDQTIGVECPKTDAVLDEIPGAYKNLDQVMANQTDLVEVVHTLKAVLNVKGA